MTCCLRPEQTSRCIDICLFVAVFSPMQCVLNFMPAADLKHSFQADIYIG